MYSDCQIHTSSRLVVLSVSQVPRSPSMSLQTVIPVHRLSAERYSSILSYAVKYVVYVAHNKPTQQIETVDSNMCSLSLT